MKTVIEMAREAGAIRIHERPKEFAVVGNEAIERFAKIVRADEREACAKVCADLWCKEPEPGDARDCYDAIRARSNT